MLRLAITTLYSQPDFPLRLLTTRVENDHNILTPFFFSFNKYSLGIYEPYTVLHQGSLYFRMGTEK